MQTPKKRKGEMHLEAEKELPPELLVSFNALVLEYKEGCLRHVKSGQEFVNYKILADLVRSGWRKSDSN